MMLTFSIFLPVDAEDKICSRYGVQLAAITALDRSYYLNPCPTRNERANYALRQAQLEELRFRFYAEHATLVAHCRDFSRS